MGFKPAQFIQRYFEYFWGLFLCIWQEKYSNFTLYVFTIHSLYFNFLYYVFILILYYIGFEVLKT